MIERRNQMDEENLIQIRTHKIVKSNDIIQKARFQLTVQEQKIILYLISKIKPKDKDFKNNAFDILDFCRVCGIDTHSGKTYANLRRTIKNLSDKSLWVKADGKEILYRWINDAVIDKNSGVIQIQFHDRMKPFLLELKNNFTQYELLYILAMQSQYGIRLYETLKSYEFRKEIIFDLEELKDILMAEKYELYGDFRKRVLVTAVREINDLSDISVKYEPIKDGKKVVKVKFLINVKEELDERLQTWQRIDHIISPDKVSLIEKIDAGN